MSGDKEGVSVDKGEDESSSLVFHPPVYIQRYLAIKDILEEEWSQDRVKKVIDFGCAEFKFFKYIKELHHINHICGIDIDKELVIRSKYEARPLPFHHVVGYSHPLTVELFAGSIAEPDERLLGANAVICIELIEHLYAEVLDKVPSTIFEYIQPELVVLTTPNADFNVLFNLKTFRHDDHKFEWTRKEFEDWCHEIILKYPYEVEFKGIGKGPDGTEHLGCCSQMAIFRRKSSIKAVKNIEVRKQYALIESYEYPFRKDDRSADEKFTDALTYRLNRVFISKIFVSKENDAKYEIPIDYLWEFMSEVCPNVETFIDLLKEKEYTLIEQNGSRVLEIAEEEEVSESDEEYFCDNLSLQDTPCVSEENWDDF